MQPHRFTADEIQKIRNAIAEIRTLSLKRVWGLIIACLRGLSQCGIPTITGREVELILRVLGHEKCGRAPHISHFIGDDLRLPPLDSWSKPKIYEIPKPEHLEILIDAFFRREGIYVPSKLPPSRLVVQQVTPSNSQPQEES